MSRRRVDIRPRHHPGRSPGLYVSTPSQLVICDLTDPIDPERLGFISLDGDVGKAALEGDIACVAAGEAGFHIVSVADPMLPVRLASVPTPAFSSGAIALRSGTAYVGCEGAGLAIYGVADPGAARQRATLGGGYGAKAYGVALGPDFLVSAGYGGLGVGWLQCEETTALPPGVAGPRRGLDVIVAPNPCNPRTTIAFTNPSAGAVQVAVHDFAGRRLAVLADGRFGAGRHELVWDGRDARGRELPSGVYLVRVTTQNGVIGRKLSLVH